MFRSFRLSLVVVVVVWKLPYIVLQCMTPFGRFNIKIVHWQLNWMFSTHSCVVDFDIDLPISDWQSVRMKRRRQKKKRFICSIRFGRRFHDAILAFWCAMVRSMHGTISFFFYFFSLIFWFSMSFEEHWTLKHARFAFIFIQNGMVIDDVYNFHINTVSARNNHSCEWGIFFLCGHWRCVLYWVCHQIFPLIMIIFGICFFLFLFLFIGWIIAEQKMSPPQLSVNAENINELIELDSNILPFINCVLGSRWPTAGGGGRAHIQGIFMKSVILIQGNLIYLLVLNVNLCLRVHLKWSGRQADTWGTGGFLNEKYEKPILFEICCHNENGNKTFLFAKIIFSRRFQFDSEAKWIQSLNLIE